MKQWIKAVGTGPNGSRDLTVDEARKAAADILDGNATPAQIGALFLAIRTKGEADTEMEGFLLEGRSRLRTEPCSHPVLDALDIGDPYDGHIRTPGLSLPAALLASSAGLPVVLHGYSDLPAKFGVGHPEVWQAMGFPPVQAGDARAFLAEHNIVCLSQETLLPEWAKLRPVRQELGLRTLLNTVEKSLNPLNAKTMIAGYFHEVLASRLHQLLRKVYPDKRIILVAGSEGAVDLHAHRRTRYHPYDETSIERQFSIPLPETFPPLPQLDTTPQAHAQFAWESLLRKDHPHRGLVRRMAAFFLTGTGRLPSIEQALEALPEEPSFRP
ncbi:MAG: anthranilate phosphoribosyltransferase [Leptospirales bacterium]